MRLSAKIIDENPAHASVTIWQNGGNTGTNVVTSDCAQQFVDYINAYEETALVDQAKGGQLADAERTADHNDLAEQMSHEEVAADTQPDAGHATGEPVRSLECVIDAIALMVETLEKKHPVEFGIRHGRKAISICRAELMLANMESSRIDRDLDRGLNLVDAAILPTSAEPQPVDTEPAQEGSV